jgi:hypothetical protein
MRIKRLTIVAIAAILIGIVVFVGSIGAMWWSWTRIMASGHGITVPAEVDLDVAPGEEIAIWRELAGTHITVNQPLLPPPDDLVLSVTDRKSGEPIQVESMNWTVRQKIMPGFERSRRALAVFDSPSHGEITVSIVGSFEHPQVYRVSPSVREWVATFLPIIQIGSAVGIVMFLTGVVILIGKALRQEKSVLIREDF